MRTKELSSCLAACLVGVAALAGPVSASSWLPFDLRGQLQGSQLVLEGHIDRVFPCPDPESGFPRTCAMVTGQRFLKGRATSGKVTLFVPGGTLSDGTVVNVAGTPALVAGDVVLLSTTVKAGSQDMVALTNFDTAFIRRVTNSQGVQVAANPIGRAFLTLPLDGRPRVVPKPVTSTVGTDEPSRPPLVSMPEMPWEVAVKAVAQGIAVVAATSSGTPAATIAGATGN